MFVPRSRPFKVVPIGTKWDPSRPVFLNPLSITGTHSRISESQDANILASETRDAIQPPPALSMAFALRFCVGLSSKANGTRHRRAIFVYQSELAS